MLLHDVHISKKQALVLLINLFVIDYMFFLKDVTKVVLLRNTVVL